MLDKDRNEKRGMAWRVAAIAMVFWLPGVVQAGAVLLQCDVGGCGPLQSGWTALDSCGTFTNVGGTGIDVTLATGNPGVCECRNPGGSGLLADVEADLLFANDENTSPGSDFILTLNNLASGATYRLLSFHNRSDEGDTVIPSVTVSGATVISAPGSIVQNHAIMDNPAEFIFVPTGGEVSFRYRGPDGGCPGCQVFMNGFTLELSGPVVSFYEPSSGEVESAHVAEVTVVLSEEVNEAVTVDYAVVGGTAERGTDYLLSDGTLSFAPRQTINTINIIVLDDGLDEDDETIIIELSNPTGGGVMLGGVSRHTYTIIDPRPTVEFASTASSDSEGTGTDNIPVVLSAPVDSTVSVDYAVVGGTATGGVDYTLLGTGTLQFAPFDVSENIQISVVDDTDTEEDETVVIELSNVTGGNARLGSNNQHTYTIVDDDEGIRFDDLVWFYSDYPSPLTVVDGALRWDPEKGGQIITRLPDQPLSSPGDYVEITYWWMTDGQHDCPDCFSCELYCFDDDITCIAGTSDMRAGLFEADGEYITHDGFDVSSSVFEGYKGYGWRFGPNMEAEPTRWVDCTGEVHKTGMFQKKPVGLGNLLTTNDGLKDRIPGFELPPGEWSLWTISLERLSSSEVELSITLNDRTYTWTDEDSSDQPSKIDVFAIHMRNGRPYSELRLRPVCEPPAGDADLNCVVDWRDLKLLADNWLTRCRYGGDCGDVNGDWRVNLFDLQTMGAHWGESTR